MKSAHDVGALIKTQQGLMETETERDVRSVQSNEDIVSKKRHISIVFPLFELWLQLIFFCSDWRISSMK